MMVCRSVGSATRQAAYAFSVILNSPVQIALVLAPLLVLISQIFGLASLTLVFSPMLVDVSEARLGSGGVP